VPIRRLEAYHVPDNGTLKIVGHGKVDAWLLEYAPGQPFEDYVVWHCEACKRLIHSNESLEYGYR